MAVKDHTLDEKIINSARAEFLELGFRKASLHKIAEKAGITTGALYTRYRNKDALFLSLVEELLAVMTERSAPMRAMYEQVQANPSEEKLLEAISCEEKLYLDLLFEHYEACVLFFCRSDGSSLEHAIAEMMESKSRETIAFLKSIAKHNVDLDGVAMIMGEQFHYYRQILEKGYDKEKAVSCMKTVEAFLNAGWRELFRSLV